MLTFGKICTIKNLWILHNFVLELQSLQSLWNSVCTIFIWHNLVVPSADGKKLKSPKTKFCATIHFSERLELHTHFFIIFDCSFGKNNIEVISALLDLGVTQNLSQHEYLIQIDRKIRPWFPRDNSKCQKRCPNAVFWGWTSLFLISRSRHVFTNLPSTNLRSFY